LGGKKEVFLSLIYLPVVLATGFAFFAVKIILGTANAKIYAKPIAFIPS
jgi:hypothetical protein